MEHAQVALVEVVRACAPKTTDNYNPLFQTIAQLVQSGAPQKDDLPSDLDRSIYANLQGIDMLMTLRERHDGSYDGVLTYNASIFAPLTAGRMVEQFLCILRCLVTAPDASMSMASLQSHIDSVIPSPSRDQSRSVPSGFKSSQFGASSLEQPPSNWSCPRSGAQRIKLLESVMQAVSEVTGRADATRSTPLLDLGFDSMTSLEFAAEMEKRTSIAFPPTLIFDLSTPDAIADHLFANTVGQTNVADAIADHFMGEEPVTRDLRAAALVRASSQRNGHVDDHVSLYTIAWTQVRLSPAASLRAPPHAPDAASPLRCLVLEVGTHALETARHATRAQEQRWETVTIILHGASASLPAAGAMRTVLSLVQIWIASQPPLASQWMIVTIGVQLPAPLKGEGHCTSVAHGGGWGAVPVMLMEEPSTCANLRVCDVARCGLARQPWDALRLLEAGSTVCHDGDTMLPRLRRSASEASPPPLLRWQCGFASSILVIGGLGGLGLQAAGWLHSRGAERVTLTSRSGQVPRAGQELDDQLQALRAGGFARVLCADASQPVDIIATLGCPEPLTGQLYIPHVEGGGPARSTTCEQLSRVFLGKASGGWHMHAALEARLGLQVSLFASSVASFGGVRSMAYSAANAYLDCLTRHSVGRGLQSRCANLPVLRDTGTGAAAFARQLQDANTAQSSIALSGIDVLSAVLDGMGPVPGAVVAPLAGDVERVLHGLAGCWVPKATREGAGILGELELIFTGQDVQPRTIEDTTRHVWTSTHGVSSGTTDTRTTASSHVQPALSDPTSLRMNLTRLRADLATDGANQGLVLRRRATQRDEGSCLMIAPSFTGDDWGYDLLWKEALGNHDVYALLHPILCDMGAKVSPVDYGWAVLDWWVATVSAAFGQCFFDVIGASFGTLAAWHVALGVRAVGIIPQHVVLIDPLPPVKPERDIMTTILGPHFAALVLVAVHHNVKHGTQRWNELDEEINQVPADALGYYVAAEVLPSKASKEELLLRGQKEGRRIRASADSNAALCDLMESVQPLDPASTTAPAVMMVLATERKNQFDVLVEDRESGLDERHLKKYGSRLELTLQGSHFDVCARCLNNRSAEFTTALEGFLSTDRQTIVEDESHHVSPGEEDNNSTSKDLLFAVPVRISTIFGAVPTILGLDDTSASEQPRPTIPLTVEKVFALISERLNKRPELGTAMGGAVAFSLSTSNTTYVIDGDAGTSQQVESVPNSVGATIMIADADFEMMAAGNLSGFGAYLSGMRAVGDVDLAHRTRPLFEAALAVHQRKIPARPRMPSWLEPGFGRMAPRYMAWTNTDGDAIVTLPAGEKAAKFRQQMMILAPILFVTRMYHNTTTTWNDTVLFEEHEAFKAHYFAMRTTQSGKESAKKLIPVTAQVYAEFCDAEQTKAYNAMQAWDEDWAWGSLVV